VPSRHSMVCQARFGRPRASALTEIGRWLASRRISFGGRPQPDQFFAGNGAVPGAQTVVFGIMPATYDNPSVGVDRASYRESLFAPGRNTREPALLRLT
jgi:hypothetical protein